jgi:hypothetical protein
LLAAPCAGESAMSVGMILVVIAFLVLLGGLSGRFRRYGYGMGHAEWDSVGSF